MLDSITRRLRSLTRIAPEILGFGCPVGAQRTMDSSDLKRRSARELVELAAAQGVDGAAALRRSDLVVALLQVAARRGDELSGDGVLEVTADGFGFLRSPDLSYQPGADDVYVSPSQIRRFELRTGDMVAGVIRPPKEGERFVALLKVATVNGKPPEGRRPAADFTDHDVALPSRWLDLGGDTALLRGVDLLAPLPAGGRALVLGAPGSGATALVAAMAGALAARHRDLAVHLVHLDRPREDLVELVAPPGVEVATTALDEPPSRHVQVAELAMARAERMAEAGRDVVLVLDSLAALSRALHAVQIRPAGAIDPAAMHRLRSFLAAGRALAAGGSLTVVGAARLGGSPLDAATVEALEPAASSTIRLDPTLGASLPVDPRGTGARRTDRYLTSAHHDAVERLRAELLSRPPAEAAARLAELVAGQPTTAAVVSALG
jgi:transcription termination factor Rho